ncbi:hypothetical protein Dimus_015716 [Dionaea muscipula]
MVRGIFVPSKRTLKNHKRFGFVRFASQWEADSTFSGLQRHLFGEECLRSSSIASFCRNGVRAEIEGRVGERARVVGDGKWLSDPRNEPGSKRPEGKKKANINGTEDGNLGSSVTVVYGEQFPSFADVVKGNGQLVRNSQLDLTGRDLTVFRYFDIGFVRTVLLFRELWR